jgi:uncharacterized protein YdhG (YjbR/CyaY superfamily)
VSPAAATVAGYLAKLPRAQRAALQRLRAQIRAAAPGAEECVSYRVPAFRLNGRMLVWYAAMSRHCSFFPGGIVHEFKDELRGYETAKGTIRFTPDKPLPAALVRRIVKARIAANASRPAKAARRAKTTTTRRRRPTAGG